MNRQQQFSVMHSNRLRRIMRYSNDKSFRMMAYGILVNRRKR